MFVTYIVTGFLVSSFTVAVIMLIKKMFRKSLSAKWHYHLWFILLIALTIPLIPKHVFDVGHISTFIQFNPSSEPGAAADGTVSHAPGDTNWLEDFTMSVDRSAPPFLNRLIACIWIAGIAFLSVPAVHAWLRIKHIKRTASPLKNKEVLNLLEQCKQQLNLSNDVIVGESPLVRTPAMFGFRKTYVVFPLHFTEWLSESDIKYILLHELNHYKNKDHITNYWIVAFQLLYWFNPLVWMAFKEMRLDREIACDIEVLKSLEEPCYAEYGYTMIHVADRVSRHMNFVLESQMAGSKGQLKRRIQEIASFKYESKQLKRNSIAIFILASIIVGCQIPFVTVKADDHDHYHFESDRVVYEDLSSYFTGYDGSFVLYDLRSDQFRIYNKEKSELRVSPDSTFKIYSALFGLESNAITSENSVMKWNGEIYPYAAWNRNQDLNSAMKGSVNWYFQELEKKFDSRKWQAYLKRIGYGNANLSGDAYLFWLESSLKISPVEQVQLLKALYTNQFGFKEQNIQTIKDAIKLENREGALLSGKTGTGMVNNKNRNGWFIGYVENKGNTYFFATNIQSKDHSTGSKAAEITLSILEQKGMLPAGLKPES